MGMDKWTLWHIGLSVKNLDQAVIYYKSLGGKADDAPGHILDSANFKDFRTYGKSTAPPWKIKIKMVQLGPLMLELTEPVEGGNYNETYMDQHGEGVEPRSLPGGRPRNGGQGTGKQRRASDVPRQRYLRISGHAQGRRHGDRTIPEARPTTNRVVFQVWGDVRLVTRHRRK